MVVVTAIIFFLVYPSVYGGALTPFKSPDPKSNLVTCVSGIIMKYYPEKKLSYFNFVPEEDKLLGHLHSLHKMSIAVRTIPTKAARNNLAYMIIARNGDEFTEHINSLSNVDNWDPYMRFLIVINALATQHLEKVFNAILKVRAVNVVVANGTETTELYTFNPYEKGCGKYYDRVIELGKCGAAESVNLYPRKVKDLRNCVFNVSCPKWPPYSVHSDITKDNPVFWGTEQYIFHLMSQIEHFKYNFTYNYDAEAFSTVSSNMSVSGPMSQLLTNSTDVMLGGLILTYSRAKKFAYVHGHLDQMDEIKIMVKKASITPKWKNFYLEFTPQVWALLLIVLVFYTIVMTVLLRTPDKVHVLMVLLDHLVLHGPKFHSRPSVSVILICWAWFAYLINCFYQSSLVSLSTKPSSEYQIKDEQCMHEHGLQPCVSSVMSKFMKGEYNTLDGAQNDTIDVSCERLMQSIRTVSQSSYLYTISLYNVYLYNEHEIYDEYGNSPIYSFSIPYTRVIYALYLYKGFPMRKRLYSLALRIRETGLSDRHLDRLFYTRQIKYSYRARKAQTRFAVPWYVYIVGVSLATFTFFVEIATKTA